MENKYSQQQQISKEKKKQLHIRQSETQNEMLGMGFDYRQRLLRRESEKTG